MVNDDAPPRLPDLRGKVGLVTGGASGLGLGIARAFAREGMRIVLADIDEAALATARQGLAESGADVAALPLDVADPEAWTEAGRRLDREIGPVHVLCNNAGVTGGRRPLLEVLPEDWDWVFGVNVRGILNGARALVPRMVAHGQGGYVVNTASIVGLFPVPLQAPYCASKFAALGLSEIMRIEFAPLGVGVSVLCPGLVATELRRTSLRRRPSGPGLPAAAAGQPAGIPPDPVGGLVVDAVRSGRFYVFSHPEYARVVEGRAESILGAFARTASDHAEEDVTFLGGESLRLHGGPAAPA